MKLLEEARALRRALEEIVLRTSAYQDDPDWPLVSGVHSRAREALERIATSPVVDLLAEQPMTISADMVRAACESRARDEEGEFPSLGDLIGFSGENKTHAVVRHAISVALGGQANAQMIELHERTPEAREAYMHGYETGRSEGRAAAYRDLLGQLSPEQHTAMLMAASSIPLERENGGIEYPPFKVFKVMLAAYVAEREKREAKRK